MLVTLYIGTSLPIEQQPTDSAHLIMLLHGGVVTVPIQSDVDTISKDLQHQQQEQDQHQQQHEYKK